MFLTEAKGAKSSHGDFQLNQKPANIFIRSLHLCFHPIKLKALQYYMQHCMVQKKGTSASW